MSRKMLIAAFGIVLLLISLAAPAKQGAYRVVFYITQIGQPEISTTRFLKDGIPGSIDLEGPDRYTLKTTVTNADQGKVKITTNFKSTSSSTSRTLIVKEGQEASFSAGEVEVKLSVTRRGG